jgi:hypothetical protein
VLLANNERSTQHLGARIDHLERTEIDQDGAAVGPDDDVVGRDVPMHDVLRMGIFERVKDLLEDSLQLRRRRRLLPVQEPRLESWSLEVFHDHVTGVVLLDVMDDLDDVGMVELAELVGRPLEPVQRPADDFPVPAGIQELGRIFARCETAWKEFLDRHPAPGDRTDRFVGDSEPALAQDADQPVTAYL